MDDSIKINISGFLGLACIGLIPIAFYIEYIYMLDPCPLCIIQRIFYVISGLILLSLFFKKHLKNKRVILYILLSSNILGFLTASRQIYLQSLPPELAPSCQAGMSRIFEVYPFLEALKMVFYGTGECAIIDFTIFGLSLAVWSGAGFFALIIWNIVLSKVRARQS